MTRDNVERVARLMAASKGLDWDGKAKGTEYANHGYWMPIACTAMVATMELAAEDLRAEAEDYPSTDYGRWMQHAADWLLSRANELKETDGE